MLFPVNRAMLSVSWQTDSRGDFLACVPYAIVVNEFPAESQSRAVCQDVQARRSGELAFMGKLPHNPYEKTIDDLKLNTRDESIGVYLICYGCQKALPESQFATKTSSFCISCKADPSKQRPKGTVRPAVVIGYVYFIQADELIGLIKIGFTVYTPERRLRSIQGQSPVLLHVAAYMRGTRKDEKVLHKRFDYCRNHHEWFNQSPELLMFIDGLVRNGLVA